MSEFCIPLERTVNGEGVYVAQLSWLEVDLSFVHLLTDHSAVFLAREGKGGEEVNGMTLKERWSIFHQYIIYLDKSA